MENLLEYLIPIIAFALWAISKFMDREKRDDSRPGPSQEEQDAQARRIQEEIRRKIAERRHQQSPSGPPPMSPQPAQRQGPPPLQRTSPYSSPPLSQHGQPIPRQAPPPAPAYREPEPVRDIFAELAEQEERLRESQRRAEQVRARTRKQFETAEPVMRRYSSVPRSGGSLRSEILSTLRDPKAARQAILYQEILGTPVGQRRQGQMRPAWES